MAYRLAYGSLSTDYEVGDTFEMVEQSDGDAHSVGDIISLYKGCDTRNPIFTTVNGNCSYNHAGGKSGCYERWKDLKPTPETIEKVKKRKEKAIMKANEQKLKELGETIAQAQKQYDELQAQVEAEAKKPVHIGELLKGGDCTINSISNLFPSHPDIKWRAAGTEFQTRKQAEEVAAKRLQRNQLEAWVYQEMEDGEVRDASVYLASERSVGIIVLSDDRFSIGEITMPHRLARILRDKVNSGEWTL